MILGIQRNQPLDERLDEMTGTFFESVAEFSAGYAPGCVAVAALVYHLAHKTKARQGLMHLSPAVRLFANSRGEGGKTYCDAESCGADVVLAANRMPAYWRRMQGNLEQSACEDDASVLNSLAVASPPVMCWICGEGFRTNTALKAHCATRHGDYAEYRKRFFWTAQPDGELRFMLSPDDPDMPTLQSMHKMIAQVAACTIEVHPFDGRHRGHLSHGLRTFFLW